MDLSRRIKMRKIIVLSFITLDGVMQAPGGPGEDPSGNFTHEGWVAGYWDDLLSRTMDEQMGRPFDLLLGRKTYDIFAGYWSKIPDSSINKATKYVVTHRPFTHDWEKSIQISGDVVAGIIDLKEGNGPEIQVHGSSNLIQTLLKHDLVDEFWLKIFPVTLGKGKRLFGEGAIPAAFKLIHNEASPNGIIIANFKRAGEVKTGSF